MTIETTSILTGCAIIGITGVIGLVYRHISNSNKHPCKKDIVFTNVCDPKMKRLEDCIEIEIADRKDAYKELREDMKTGFEEVKELIRNKRV